MSDIGIQTAVKQPSLATPGVKPSEPPDNAGKKVLKVIQPLASLRLTVVLFVLSIVIVFCGTLAQVDAGIWTVVSKYFRSLFVWIPFQIFFPRTMSVTGGFPFPGGWLIGSLLLVNLLAAHAVRFKLTRKRSGVLILHLGLIIMMVSELVTGLFAVEGNMTIENGRSANFLEHRDVTELAIIDPSDPKTDDVVVIPQALLRRGGRISHEALPFDVETVRYMVNSSEPKEVPSGFNNPATAGDGLKLTSVEKPEVSGTDAEQKLDLASAYVTITKKGSGEALGTYLVSIWFSALSDRPTQQLTVDGKTYEIALRFKRSYKPYTLQLLKFTHEVYPATDTPKDFRSRVRLIDPTRNEDREVEIYMNEPLRYEGETFYQSGFLPGDKGTILQVVRNPGWLMPYVSCVLVALGMLIHFGIHLVGFLRSSVKRPAPGVRKEDTFAYLLPGGIVAVVGLCLLLLLIPSKESDDQMQLYEFSQLPIIDRGRVKPLDTLARNSLMVISNRQYYVDDKGKSHPAIEWLLDVMTSGRKEEGPAMNHKVFRIENDQVLSLLGLTPRSGLRYALNEFVGKVDVLAERANRARMKDDKQRDLFEAKLIDLAKQLELYIDLAQLKTPRAVPPTASGDDWKSVGEALAEMQNAPDNPNTMSLGMMMVAYSKGDTKSFNRELAAYQKRLNTQMPDKLQKADFEVGFNHFEPFYICLMLYAVVFFLGVVSWLGWTQPLNRTAFALAVLTLVIHTGALFARMYIQDRPLVFVTNLYSSAVFIGWGCVVLGLILELLYRNGIGNVIAGVLGFVTLVIGHNLAAGGDTLEMMQAVLDTNFWLATHVTCVTAGYTATFVAGFLGLLFILLGVLTTRLNKHSGLFKTLSQMIYGIVCFATLLSFTGTVLGGIWADQSWGRFWGWDPKENGALIIVIWNALILHARWSGLVKQRGIAVLAVAGNIVTAWSWFGVNMLGVGLHSYGFMAGAVWWLLAFETSQLAIIGLGLLPLSMWRSFSNSSLSPVSA